MAGYLFDLVNRKYNPPIPDCICVLADHGTFTRYTDRRGRHITSPRDPALSYRTLRVGKPPKRPAGGDLLPGESIVAFFEATSSKPIYDPANIARAIRSADSFPPGCVARIEGQDGNPIFLTAEAFAPGRPDEQE